jgi:lipopolysaccharide/colanic/teichoic acid biosynthesis glycosyltransferase
MRFVWPKAKEWSESTDSERTPQFDLQAASVSNRHKHSNRLFAEDAFRKMLCWERKRVERSDRSLWLMLVDVERVIQAHGGDGIVFKTVSALCAAMRETDIAGWYTHGATLGVIFVDIPTTQSSASQGVIRARVMGALRAKLDAKQVGQLRFSFHLFPQDWSAGNDGHLPDRELYPDLFDSNEAQRWPRLVKRAVDIVGSVLALVILSPLLLLIAAAIKLTSKGPILFRQERVGWHGARFVFLKFRSMKCESDPSIHREYVKRFIAEGAHSEQSPGDGKPVYKIKNDPRVTRLGRFLRKTSLDELPQFINVLKGEMSLVGPRPPIPYELEAYRVWHRRRVLEVKPGITGLWQVHGRSRLKFDDMVRLDLKYSRTCSLWLDIKILLQTPRAALFGKGAY